MNEGPVGKTNCFFAFYLNPLQIFNLLPVQRASMYPYEVNDPEACLRVRSKRSILPYPVHDDSNAYSVFEVLVH